MCGIAAPMLQVSFEAALKESGDHLYPPGLAL
jgi:hypothetical protein